MKVENTVLKKCPIYVKNLYIFVGFILCFCVASPSKTGSPGYN